MLTFPPFHTGGGTSNPWNQLPRQALLRGVGNPWQTYGKVQGQQQNQLMRNIAAAPNMAGGMGAGMGNMGGGMRVPGMGAGMGNIGGMFG